MSGIFCLTIVTSGKLQGHEITFAENKGQLYDQNHELRPDIKFYGTIQNVSFFLRADGISYQFNKTLDGGTCLIHRIDLVLLEANLHSVIYTGQPTQHYENHFLGTKSTRYVKKYKIVRYESIYPGIDVKYYEQEGNLKYDYLVSPKANYKKIKIKVNGATSIKLNTDGSISLQSSLGTMTEAPPKVYQDGKPLLASWVVNGDIISFQIEHYDPSKSIIIDPLVYQWSKGVPHVSTLHSCTVDKNGNSYLWGPSSANSIVRKYSSTGIALLMQGYSGTATNCKTDNNGNLFVIGFTNSNIATSGAYQTTISGGTDGFISKISATGSILWTTLYGAAGNDFLYDCCIDSAGNLYAVGKTASLTGLSEPSSHQVTYGGGSFDGFIVKFNTLGNKIWSTYYGGASEDVLSGCAIDTFNNLYACGTTKSSSGISSALTFQNFLSGNTNAFLVRLDTNGARLWGSYYGGDSTTGERCTTDHWGDVYLCGSTTAVSGISSGTVFLSSYSGSIDGYLVKFDAGGSRKWATYIGGSASEEAKGLGANRFGRIYVVGFTQSTNNIATPHSYQSSNIGGHPSGFLLEFDTSGQRTWGTYRTSGSSLPSAGITSCAADDSGNVFIAGFERVGLSNFQSFMDKFSFISSGTNGIANIEKASLKLVPNPTGDIFRVVNSTPARLEVFNAEGKKVLSILNEGTVSLGNLPAGIYLVRLFNDFGFNYFVERITKL